MLDAKVIPLLFGLELSDLSGPLSQFQALKVDQQGLLDVVKAINSVAENKAAEATIHQLVPALWPQLQHKLDDIPDKEPSDKHMRPQTEILEDLVSQVRGLGARMRDFDPDVIERDPRYWNPRFREFDVRMLDEMMHTMIDSRDGEMTLVLLAGFVRDRMPWLAEVFLESHREFKNAGPEEAREIGHRLMRMVKQTTRGPFGERLLGKSKSGHFLMMELPHLVDRAVSLRIESRHISDGKGVDEADDEA
jgi:hypothetical protein